MTPSEKLGAVDSGTMKSHRGGGIDRAMTSDVCDKCWGSGKENQAYPGPRAVYETEDEKVADYLLGRLAACCIQKHSDDEGWSCSECGSEQADSPWEVQHMPECVVADAPRIESVILPRGHRQVEILVNCPECKEHVDIMDDGFLTRAIHTELAFGEDYKNVSAVCPACNHKFEAVLSVAKPSRHPKSGNEKLGRKG